MACTLNYKGMQSIHLDCNDIPVGGLKSIRYAYHKDVVETTPGKPTISASKLKEIRFNKKDGATNFTEVTTSQANGSQSTVPTLTVQLNGLNATTRQALDAISSPLVKLAIVAEDANGTLWVLGRKYGMVLTEVTAGTGASNGDFNGYNLTFTGEENELAAVITVSQ